jgi:energy-coupling factor transporter ATP-binding protein EcfA2
MYPINDPLVVWPLYEPSQKRHIALDAEALVQHVLILGSTGCGKSTLLTSAAQQLIRHRPQRIGLLVLDAKQDGTVERVTQAARAAGREGDLAMRPATILFHLSRHLLFTKYRGPGQPSTDPATGIQALQGKSAKAVEGRFNGRSKRQTPCNLPC